MLTRNTLAITKQLTRKPIINKYDFQRALIFDEDDLKKYNIYKNMKTFKNLNNNEITVLKAVCLASIEYTGGEFTYFDEVMEQINDLKENQVKGYLSQLSKKELVNLIQKLNYSYYIEGKSLVSDELYDYVKEVLRKIDSKHPILDHVGVSKVYKTCPFSDNKGFLTCDEYNLFLRGELKPKSN